MIIPIVGQGHVCSFENNELAGVEKTLENPRTVVTLFAEYYNSASGAMQMVLVAKMRIMETITAQICTQIFGQLFSYRLVYVTSVEKGDKYGYAFFDQFGFSRIHIQQGLHIENS